MYWLFCLRASAVVTGLAAALLVSSLSTAPAQAQATSPANPPPADTVKNTPDNKATPPSCPTAVRADALPGGAYVLDPTDGQRKSWQPFGGELVYRVGSATPFAQSSKVLVCFGWRTLPSGTQESVLAEVRRQELSADQKTLTLTVIVPQLPKKPDKDVVHSMGIVPVANVFIFVQGDGPPILARTSLGITSVKWSFAIAFLVGLTAFAVLLFVSCYRLGKSSHVQVHPLLTPIATPGGFASLSQFQILLWTFVVLVSAVYVMLLSGELIEITTGTLVLLGISGVATIGSKMQSSDPATAPAPAGPPPPVVPPPAQPRRPQWSDLITDYSGDTPQIDVTRVQMLYFTFVTAAFVAQRVLTTYVIPVIPDGFLILMGISNSVYLGSKFVPKK